MIWILRRLLFGHVHKWELLKVHDLRGENEFHESSIIGVRYILRCEKCGDVKKRDLS